ncbi:hypothetical protein HRE53_06965 [Acaryochloris sp. 'Moss Beach']|uniref:hypothetical protein n=2 Tax=Acaryochloris TaxID=155977 RepID=UPI001F45AFE0|nr:hypothetical protein [Acaryochloris sp. 'Moss Beach']UJB70790.1 hypothetical protein HRE53_06965 [Acaryochloris sp. 'Moss Beach']
MKRINLLGLLMPFQLMTAPAFAAKTCSPYRVNYESAISQGLITRPSLVNNAGQSWNLFQVAMRRNDRIEAASRAAQYLVILSEYAGDRQANQARHNIEQEMVGYYQQPVEVAMPMFEVILENSPDCLKQ